MDFTIKSEPDSQLSCFACLKNDRHMFEEHKIPKEIILTYKGIVKDLISHAESSVIVICIDCMEILTKINEFQKKCIQSIQVLVSNVGKVEKEHEPEEIYVDQIYTPIVKEEENSSDDMMKSEVAEPEVNVENEPKPSKPKRMRPSKSKTQTFCPVCCNSHPDSHNHAIELHSRGYEKDGSLNCLVCSHVCEDVTELLLHLESHKEFDHPKKCGRCDMVTKDRHEFVRHVQKDHFKQKKRLYTCDFCESVFTNSVMLKYHTRSHLGGLKCNYCEKSFFDKQVYDEHIEFHKERMAQIKFVCDHCGYVSPKKVCLKKHIQHHHTSPDENMTCPTCKKTYPTKFLLSKHLYRSHKEKKFPCSFCGKMYGSNNLLKQHVMHMHEMDAAQKRERREHFRPKVRKYACDECDKKFYSTAVLKRHKHSHNKTRPFNCTLCKTGYYTNMYLRKHFLREHQVVKTTKEITKMCGLKNQDSD